MTIALPIQSECMASGACGCAHILDCSARDLVAALARRLEPHVAAVTARWIELLGEARLPSSLAEEPAALRERCAAMAAGNTPAVAASMLRAAQALRERGATLPAVVTASQLLHDAMSGVLVDVSGAPLTPSEAHALRQLSWVHAAISGVAFGASPRESHALEAAPPAELGARAQLAGLIGASQVMRRLYGRIELAARGRDTVLIVGESGVGKELVARAIHALGSNPGAPFVPVNCAALPGDLVESELFGHERGAFSGAAADYPGLVRAAHGGTLFLDEVTELQPSAQAKLLRMLQEHTVRPVGSVRERSVDVRVVAATNRRASEAVQTGVLRRDLYYRLQRLVIEVPALRDRMSDLPLLVSALAERWRVAYAAPRAKSLSPAALDRLLLHIWPGNVRELENVIFSASLAAPGNVIRLEDLPPLEDGQALEPGASVSTPVAPVSMEQAERQVLVQALETAKGNKSHAARVLGISRKRLYAKMRRYGLEA